MNNKQIIISLIRDHIAKNPSDTGDFIHAITAGLNEFANNQRDMASVWFNDLSLLMEANPKAKDHKLRSFGEIASRVLPFWERAPIHAEMKKKWQPRIDKYYAENPDKKPVVIEEGRKPNERDKSKDDRWKEDKVSEKFGTF